MAKFSCNLIQIGNCIQANDDAVLIDAAGLLGTMTEKGWPKQSVQEKMPKLRRHWHGWMEFLSPILLSMPEQCIV
jgi:hypothetical protein